MKISSHKIPAQMNNENNSAEKIGLIEKVVDRLLFSKTPKLVLFFTFAFLILILVLFVGIKGKYF